MTGAMALMKKKWIWFALVLIFFIADQLSKAVIQLYLSPYETFHVFPGLNLVLVFNSGSAFGFLSQTGHLWHQWFFSIFSVFMSVFLTVWMIRIPAKAHGVLLGLSLILGGALGNLADRLRIGYVIDFIDLYCLNHHWFVFNIADSAICVGAVILFFSNQDKTKSGPFKQKRS